MPFVFLGIDDLVSLLPLRRGWGAVRLAWICRKGVGVVFATACLMWGMAAMGQQDVASERDVVTGMVRDATGARLAGARVELRTVEGASRTSTVCDGNGDFRLANIAAGTYRLTVSVEGFEPLTRTVRVGGGADRPLTLTMRMASVSTNVVVNADDEIAPIAPDANKDAASVGADDLKSLPVLDGNVLATLSAFLDAGASGETGSTLVVDGVERSALGVAPSSIERVSINQDPYSAQYPTPGRGQIEVITKVAEDHVHGQVNFTYRDSALDATNYFATTKPPEDRRTYDATVTGPIPPWQHTAFIFSLYREEEDAFNAVSAITGTGVLDQENVAAPMRATGISMKVSRQYNAHHSAYLTYEMYRASNTNQSVGGLTLASAGYVASNFDQDVFYHDDLAISPTRLNSLTLYFEDNDDTTASDVQAPQVNVEGAFNGGGAQNESVNTEYNPKIVDIFSWTTTGKTPGGTPHIQHQIKFGIQIPNLGRRVIEDKNDRQGTYTFSSLAAYAANTPTTFSLQQGQERFLTLYAQPEAFVLDQIQATPKLTVTPGLRYDFQNSFPGTMNGFEPRLSLAYLADKKHAMVVRIGGGLYIRRVGVNIGQDLARYEHAAERSLLLTTDLCYPDITVCNPLAAQPSNLINFQPNIKSPEQAYFGLSVERALAKGLTFTVGYSGYRGWHALRSIDINAPLPPFTSSWRPNAAYGQILQLNSGGYQKTDGLTVSLRGRIGRYYTGFAQYVLQHADSNTEWSFFHPQNQFDPNAEWSRTNSDQRQKLSMLGTFFPAHAFNFGFGFYGNTPTPYTVLTGTDAYHTGLTNARPAGVPRNSRNGGSYEDLELKAQYLWTIRPKLKQASPKLGVSLSSFNTLNGVNYQSYVQTVSSPLFGQPTTAGSPRRLQLGGSFTF